MLIMFFLQPQRPLRALRVRNDENMPPDGPLAKTIHQRNKSSPALTTITTSVALKGATKRTAFGDVSNIVNIARPSKDDSSLPSKPGLQPPSKISQLVPEKRSATFLRPAQRPLSVSSLKNLLTGTTNSGTIETVSRVPLNDSNALPAQTRKALTRRATTVFKDTSLDTVKENEDYQIPLRKPSLPAPVIHVDDIVPTAVETQPYLPAPEQSVVPEPSKDSQYFHSDTSLPGIDEVTLDASSLPSEPNVDTYVNNQASDVRNELDVHMNQAPGHDNELPLVPALPAPATLSTVRKIEPYMLPSSRPSNSASQVQPQPQAIQPLARAEPEEYWDEEEDEGYEEEGYVTARSFRSKGDNTTGGQTTVLFPQMNQRVRREMVAAKHLVEATRTPEEIEDESYDTSMVAEYGDEIFEYMHLLEVKMLPNAHYMDNQHELQWTMRSVLMDWLVQVHHRFNLLPETLFLCVNYIDRFLSCKVVSLGKLQLVGATAIFIAAKYEEINCPSVQEIVYMVDGGYSVDEILKAERFMLTMLQFELGWPGPMSFLRRISKADDYDLETRTLAKYFLEVTLMDERFIGSPPSFTAAASHCLARLMLRKGTWVCDTSHCLLYILTFLKSPHHVFYSGYTYSQLRPLLDLLLECCEDPRKHHAAVYNKYCDKRYKRASAFVEVEIGKNFTLPNISAPKPVAQPSLVTYFDSVSYFRT